MTASTPQLVVRLGLIALLAVLLQTSMLSQLSLLGATPDIAPLVVASAALLVGPVPGAVFGFFVGLLVDVALLQTLGVTSLVYVTVAWFAGRLRETLRDPQASLVPLAVGAIGTLIALVMFSLIQFLLGVEAPVSVELLRQTLSTVLVTSLLALPVHALVRRLLVPVLPDQTRRRRRQTRPGLSPLISP